MQNTVTATSTELGFDVDGERCAATVFRPGEPGGAATAGVVIVHGFTCHRRMRLEPYVDALTRAGLAVLTYDPRHLGDSDGAPRQFVDPARLSADARAALTALRFADGIERVGIVGFSFGGGIALEVATLEPDVFAVAHVVGFVAARTRPDEEVVMLMKAMQDDLAAAERGDDPVPVAVCGAPGDAAVITSDDALDGFRVLDVDGTDPNATPARSLLGLATFDPAAGAASIHCPVRFVVASDDHVVDSTLTERLAEQLPGATLTTFDGGHFDVFRPTVAPSIADELAQWLAEAALHPAAR